MNRCGLVADELLSAMALGLDFMKIIFGKHLVIFQNVCRCVNLFIILGVKRKRTNGGKSTWRQCT